MDGLRQKPEIEEEMSQNCFEKPLPKCGSFDPKIALDSGGQPGGLADKISVWKNTPIYNCQKGNFSGASIKGSLGIL